MLGVHVRLGDVEHGGLELGLRQRHGHRGAVRVHRDGLALEPREVHERDVGALPDEQLIVVLIVLSVMFGGFQKGTKSGGLAPLATTSTSASAVSVA